jgi:hypothetical protein
MESKPMSKDALSGNKSRPMIQIGMTFDEVCTVLGGPPDGINTGSHIFLSIGSDEMRSKLFSEKYCFWQRPEGNYYLNFFHDWLESVTGAPNGTVEERGESAERNLPARFVLLVTDDIIDNPINMINTMVHRGQLTMHPDALIYSDVNPKIATNQPLKNLIMLGIDRAYVAIEEIGKTKDFLDIETCAAKRFRMTRGPSSTGVLVTISGPRNDPDSYRYLQIAPQKDICGRCGITENDRLREWNGPPPRGVIKIGSGRGAFMYCEKCKSGICGRCSIDLGMSAGCPLCKTELVYMDGGRQ